MSLSNSRLSPPLSPPRGSSPQVLVLCWASLLLVTALLYAWTLDYGFLMDDEPNIALNPSIKSFSPIWKPLFPKLLTTYGGRPLSNYGFALTYALSGMAPWGHRLGNILVHLAATLVFFSLLRRVLASGLFGERLASRCNLVAWCAALIWCAHPMHTMAVTYISQRAEAQVAFFYILTCYCAFRGWSSERSRVWHIGAAVACLLGAGSKEVIVTAPFLVWVFDWVFISSGPVRALKRSPLLYSGLLAATVCLLALVFSGRQAAAGSLAEHTDSLGFLITQAEVVVHYLRLSFWPDPLVFHYEWGMAPLSGVWPEALFLLGLFGLIFWGLSRRKGWAFLLFSVFVILSPSSSIVHTPLWACEYRMYLPLMFLAALAVCALFLLAERWKLSNTLPVALCLAAAMGLALATVERNPDYTSRLTLWRSNVSKRPENAFALQSLGHELLSVGKLEESLIFLERSRKINPDNHLTLTSLGLALSLLDRHAEALPHLNASLLLQPGYYPTLKYKILALIKLNRKQEAAALFTQLEQNPVSQKDPVASELRHYFSKQSLEKNDSHSSGPNPGQKANT